MDGYSRPGKFGISNPILQTGQHKVVFSIKTISSKRLSYL